MLESRTSRTAPNADKWREMWEICEEARRLAPAERERFLKGRSLDADLERDVISLLMEPADSVTTSWGSPSDSYLDVGGGAAVAPARSLADTRIGRYLVGDLLGRGGGGEVYAAQDTDLDRMVALKFLHPGRVGGQSVERFLREAKAASALNHPGIITVHEVIQSESGLAIAMELVDGRALRAFCGSPNVAADVMRWGRQIALALAAAHTRGIIHRDIKPENLMLRADGFVKVLDFGLAEDLMAGSENPRQPAGTLRYMSPEQAMGQNLTSASDVFSLGIVFYELLSGRHPFPADTALGALRAIATAAPRPLSSHRREILPALETLVLNMLAKQPQQRPACAEVAERLEAILRPGPARRVRPWRAAALTGVAASVLALAYFGWRGAPKAGPVTLVAPIPLTDTTGVDSHPDIAPDGESVVYVWGAHENAYTHLYLKRLDRDQPYKVLEAANGERFSNPRWSPDGKRILFKSSAPGLKYALWTVAPDGRDRRKVIDLRATDHSSGLDWSPDGRSIVYTDRHMPTGNRYVVRTLNLSTREDRVLTNPPSGVWGDWDPRFSRDGRRIAFKRVGGLSKDQILVVPLTGGEATQITTGRRGISGHTWLADQRLLVAGRFDSSVYGLWAMEARPGAPPELVHRSGLDEVAPTSRQSKVTWVTRLDDHNIYAVPSSGGVASRWIASAMYDGKPAIDGRGRVAFVSRRSGNSEIWISGPKGTNPMRLTNLKAEFTRPAWSPDGSRLVFSTEGEEMLYVAECPVQKIGCSEPVRLGPGLNASWSGDGKWIYYNTSAEMDIGRIAASGGAPQSMGLAGRDPIAPGDGKWVYYRQVQNGYNLARTRVDANGRATGAEEVLVDRTRSANREHWTVAGNEVIYWDNDTDSKFSGLRAYNMATRRTRTIIEAPAMYPAVSPDGTTLFFSRRDRSGVNVMVADLGR